MKTIWCSLAACVFGLLAAYGQQTYSINSRPHSSLATELRFAVDPHRPEIGTALTNETPFASWKKVLPKVRVGSNELWVVEKDCPMDEAELVRYSLRYLATRQTQLQPKVPAWISNSMLKKLLKAEIELHLPDKVPEMPFDSVSALDGKGARWSPGKTLTFSIDRASVTNAQHYDYLARAFNAACREWEAACGVSFLHVVSLDTAPANSISPEANSNLVFVVRADYGPSHFIALAFFPYHSPDRRQVTFFKPFFDQPSAEMRTGICRHEIGHVLGFAHEQNSLLAGPDCDRWKDPESGVVPINFYDPRSVMHYSCGESSNPLFKISNSDKTAAATIYGPPMSRHNLF